MEKTNDQVKRDADNCNSSVQVLKDTCSFMNATISRCLDYCKATVGIELCPLHESVHLEEALCWVVNCVNRTQEGKVSVYTFHLLHFCAVNSGENAIRMPSVW